MKQTLYSHNILIVEDFESMREMITSVLEMAGF